MKHIFITISVVLFTLFTPSCNLVHSTFCGDQCRSNSKTAEGNNETFTCLLSDSELSKRKLELQNEISKRIVKHKELKDGYLLFFKYDQSLNRQILDYVMAENECCPFLVFEMKLESSELIELKITGPRMAKSLIKDAIFSANHLE